MGVPASQRTSERSAERLASLDVMRGLAVAGMILVNNPGSWDDGYAFLAHAPWNGWTLADLVFPFFLVIVGVSLDLSLSRRRSGRSALLPALVRRAALLCALGILLNTFPDLSQLGSVRWFGVLQRIGLCTLAVGTLLLTTGARTQLAVAVALLAGYWLAMTTVPVPGYGAGVLTPEGNLGAWLDVRWFGGHLYREGFDPEGLLSTLPAIATTLIGALAGRFLRGGRPGHEKTLGLVAAGTALALAGEIAGWWFPINKQLWTSSYVLLTGGLGLATLGVCYELIDRRGWRLGTRPFLMLGSNALAVYLLSSLGARLMEICQISAGESCESLRRFLYEQLFQPWAGAETGSLCFALAYLLVWLIPTAELHRRRVFLKI
jgi:predicted acyltransferase